MDYEKLFKSQSVWRSVFSMAVPAVIIILVMVIYNMTDMFFIARLGDYNLVAALSIASPVFSFVSAFATMLGGGGSAKIAKALGNNEKEQARIYASLCFWGAIILGVIVAAVIILGADIILPLMGATEETYDAAKSYMCVCAAGAPFMLASMTLGNIIRAEGGVKEGMIGNIGANLVNMALDPIFILVLGWGVAGAAFATAIANLCGTLYYVLYVMRRASVMNMDLTLAARQPLQVFSIMVLGLPSAISTLLTGFAATFANRLLVGYGTDAIAARAAAGKAGMVISMVQIGITMGTQPLLAYNYGSRDVKRLKEVLFKVGMLTVIVGTASGLICYTLRGPIISLFITDAEVAQIAVNMMLWTIAASPVTGLIYLSTNFIQASGNAAPATFISLLRQGIVLIPMLYVMTWILGLYGTSAAHLVADLISLVIAVIFMIRQYRKLDAPLVRSAA